MAGLQVRSEVKGVSHVAAATMQPEQAPTMVHTPSAGAGPAAVPIAGRRKAERHRSRPTSYLPGMYPSLFIARTNFCLDFQ